MAEAHSAVAFSFSVSPDGVDVAVNHEALKAVWRSGIRSWKKRYARFLVSSLQYTIQYFDFVVSKSFLGDQFAKQPVYINFGN